MLEPYFYFIVRKKFYELFGILIDDRDSNELFNNTLNSYLTKSLNVELVNIILQAITKFTEDSFKQSLSNDQQKDEEEDPYNVLRRLEIPRIEIDNPEMWEFSKKSNEINNTADGGTEN